MRGRPAPGRNTSTALAPILIVLVFFAFLATTTGEVGADWTATEQELVFLSEPSAPRLAKRTTEQQRVAFVAFGRRFVLRLSRDASFVVDGVQVQHLSPNSTYWTPLATKDCFYSGTVDGDEHSACALSFCQHALLGHIQTSDGRFFIEPSPAANASGRHLVYRQSDHAAATDHAATDHCAVPPETSSGRVGRHRHHLPRRHGNGTHREKRSTSRDMHVEVMVVSDSKMRNYHGENLENYVLTLMSIVSLIYKDSSIGNSININVVKLVTTDPETDHDMISTSASRTLKNFCKWQSTQNDPDDRSPMHHDTAILLTREDICRSPKKCDTLGLAELGTMCDPLNSCSIVEDNGLSAAFTIAHELGHVLSMPHDDDGIKCRRFIDKPHHVMARMLDFSTTPWSWSSCSSHYLTEFLDAGSAICLLDKPTLDRLKERSTHHRLLPGELFNDNKQCELVYGHGSRICPYMPVCRLLWCTTSEQIGCRTHHMPWADGTVCGDGKWCQKGVCKERDREDLLPRDGRWGVWGQYGPCSRPCGGGIQKATRECNNPKPVNGGKFCIGRRTRYKSCSTKPCTPGTRDFREEQCSAFNGKQFNYLGIPPNAAWLPVYYSNTPKDLCKLFCRVANVNGYHLLKEKVIDGTPCSPDSFDVCVNGLCKPAGCDYRLGSRKRLDHCGICGGKNSTCKTVSGHLNRTLAYGYTDVVRIPAGSNNIDIRQRGYNNSEKDDNYIALKTAEEEYILNGNFSVILFKKLIPYGGSILEYTGAGTVVERVNSSKPLQKDLIIQVLSVKDLLPPDIHYQYTVSIGSEVQWEYEREWSQCSSMCQGERFRNPVCLHKTDRKVLEEGECWKIGVKPRQQREKCNGHCELAWRITHKSECSVTCGVGTRTLTVQCVLGKPEDSRIVADDYCKDLKNKPSSKEKCEEQCSRARWEFDAWSKCSQTCGPGIQTRTAACVLDSGLVVGDAECSWHEKTTKQECSNSDCPTWRVGKWVHCSVTCGKGEQQRPYWCEVAGRKVHGSFCDHLTKPESKRSCQEHDCAVWQHGDWGVCSSTCGSGISMRVVGCRSADGVLVADSLCNPLERPDEVTECPLAPCPTGNDGAALPSSPPLVLPPNRTKKKWRSGSWTECLASCGDGFRKRNVLCYDEDNHVTLVESECKHLPRPPGIELCKRKPCGRWRTGEWSQCSVTCGSGVKTRHVFCINSNTRATLDGDCDGQKRPASEELCNTSACPTLVDGLSNNAVDDDVVTWRTGTWGRCSRSCGGGYQRRQVVCQDDEGKLTDGCDTKRKPVETIPCNLHSCPSWISGNWGACTRTCGTGIQRRRVTCEDHQGQVVGEYECDARVRPSEEQACNRYSCGGISSGRSHRWEAGPWTSCSVTCGQGSQERQVVCVDESESRIVSPSYCEDEPPPETRQNCSVSPCPQWQLAAFWSECSASCGSGSQIRRATCVYNNETVQDSLCIGIPPSNESRACNVHACATAWHTKPWTQCNKNCGKGRQLRSVYCVDSNHNKVDDSMCDLEKRPRFRRGCNKHPCPFVWKNGHWTDCSVSCGPGVQTRSVSCHQVNVYGWMNPDPVMAGCNETERPPILQVCNYGECNDEFHWKTAAWSNCFGSCGKSFQRRRAFCMDTSNNMVPRRNCQREYRPERRRPCWLRPCGNTSCADIQQLYDVKQDGEQDLLIRGKVVKVYCADMNTSYPREFVSLPSGDRENFSEMYDKRLIRPDTCPYNGARRDSCECVDDARPRAGLTTFTKIRVNVTQLRVYTHDFTFSRRVHGQLIPYAEAADCYSTANCPQGRFSINLLGTGFIVSEFTEWVGHGTKPSVKILRNQDGMRVQGHCGGYCGKCSVDPLIGLQLDVAPP